MEGIAPILVLLYKLRSYSELNLSVRSGISDYISDPNNSSELRRDLVIWARSLDQGKTEIGPYLQRSHYRMAMVGLLERGLKGAPIHHELDRLIDEVSQACVAEVEFECAKIPFLLMIPTFVLLIPSFLLILFVPLVNEFSRLLS